VEEEEEPIQTKGEESGTPSLSSAAELSILSLKGAGSPLPSSERSFFEPRFGRDFSRVRLHADGQADSMAKSIQARAFTVGRDIFFGQGEYRSGSSEGRDLLAHELTHVVQQASSLRRVQRFVSCGTYCPSRESGEAHRARRAGLRISPLPAPDVGILISGFDINSHDVSSLPTAPGFATFWGSLVTGSNSYEILGFTDCQGGEGRNTFLRWMRAMNVNNALPSAARTNITRFAAASLTDCIASNATEAGRLQNRSVAVRLVTTRITFPETLVTATPCPPTRTSGAASLDEYTAYILCAETTTGYGPRNMLAMLRQMYYGKPWSATSTTNRWDNVIPCSPNLGNPQSRLGTNLYNALHNSAVVSGVDVGHVFTGLEAMTCPQTSVPFFLGLAAVRVPSEEFATFTGDLGAAAAAHVACNELGAAAATEESCGFLAAPQRLAFYFNEHAPPADLEGDIDPFVIRAGELGIPCTGSLGRSLTIARPISDVFHEYYSAPSSALGSARPNRYRCVLNALGAAISGNRVTNRTVIAPPLEGRVYEFAMAFYHSIRGMLTLPGPRASMGIRINARRVVDWFLTYLESRL
jgi:hypothetical protein